MEDKQTFAKYFYWIDDDFYVETTDGQTIMLKNAYISKLSYDFEEPYNGDNKITMVGNNKEW